MFLDITYYHPLFRMMERDKVRADFDAFIDECHLQESLSDYPNIYTLAELLIVDVLHTTRGDDNKTKEDLIACWNENISMLQVKLSPTPSKLLDASAAVALDKVLNADSQKVQAFRDSLRVSISNAEYRGVEYTEPLAVPSPYVLPTSERRPFFESLVPLDTSFRI